MRGFIFSLYKDRYIAKEYEIKLIGLMVSS